MHANRALISLILLFVALPSFAQKIHIDYDNATAFSEYKTFQFRETKQDLRRVSLALHLDVVGQITGYAIDGALSPTEANPDVYIAYYAAYYSDLKLVLGDLEYTYGEGFTPGSYWEGGVGTREVTKKAFTFKEGTVIVDVWDREREVLVWRGMATAALKRDYHKNEKKLAKALEKLMKQWEKTYGGRARAIRKLKAEEGG